MFFNLFQKPKIKVTAGKTQPVVLVIMDGWGIAPASDGNGITLANPQNYQSFLKTYPNAQLIAAGESVGLPANEVGNTEVGHLNIGAGRVVLQDLKRIDKAVSDGSLFENRSFYQAAFHVQKNSSKLHIMGLVSSGQVHSSMNHLYALLEFFKRANVKNVYLHLFTDGRDAPPQESESVFEKLSLYLKQNELGKIATISGRYYAMDRDRRWDRTAKAYKAMVKGEGNEAPDAVSAIKSYYARGITDEFIEPTIIDRDGLIQDGDAAIFFNYRIDRPRQLTMAFVVADFQKANISWEFDPYTVKYEQRHQTQKGEVVKTEPFDRGVVLSNLFFVTMTQYQTNIPVSAVAYPPETITDCLTQILSKNNIPQMHMAESEKERFVTYYFDGLREDRANLEDVLIVSSPKVATYDKKPEMSVGELTEEFKKALNKDIYKFVVMNIANPDMVAHTGKIPETIKAIQAVDKALADIVSSVLTCNGTVIITADHGNAEELLTYPPGTFYFTSEKGEVNTDHSTNPVPVIVINNTLKNSNKKIPNGILADVAPTILKLMGLTAPPAMTGNNLLE